MRPALKSVKKRVLMGWNRPLCFGGRLIMINYVSFAEDQVIYYAIVPAERPADGERLFVEIGKHTIVVFNIAGSFYAIGDVCSHDDGPVGDGEVEGFEIICPRHGARFDIRRTRSASKPSA